MTDGDSTPASLVIPLIDRLARIEEKLDRVREDRLGTESQFSGLGRRLDRVERFMWLTVGLAAASGVTNIAGLLGG